LYTLYNGDCLEVMPSIPSGSIDAIITDLPYGTTACKWDTVIEFAPMWKEVKRVLKPRGAFITTASQPFTSALVMSNPKRFRHEWIWEKDRGANFLQSNFQPIKTHENILVFSVGKTTYNPQKTINPNKHSRTDILQLSDKRKEAGLSVSRFVSSNKYENDKLMPRSIQYFTRNVPKGGTLHPTQKPVALYEYLIKTYTNAGETVLDIAMGSGTTIEAAERTGRNSIGIEKEEDIFLTAKQRIEKAGCT
jgi:site-specific DNA-methyltransferase (adenine-specific)